MKFEDGLLVLRQYVLTEPEALTDGLLRRRIEDDRR